jgi:hypothetical protein
MDLGETMKHVCYIAWVMSVGLCCIGCNAERNLGKADTALDGTFWSYYSSDPESRKQEVWTEDEGVLVCSGAPLGYLYSNADFDDFVLTLEWRWPADTTPGKGGVLIRMTGEHKVWPKSLEAQLNAGDAGDFWGLDGYELIGPISRSRSIDHESFGKLTNIQKTQGVEKRPGQWNTYEIVAEGETVTLLINGMEVNRATGCAPRRGKVCLTSEGSEIHFRNVKIAPLAQR